MLNCCLYFGSCCLFQTITRTATSHEIRLMLDWIIFVLGQLYNQICDTFASRGFPLPPSRWPRHDGGLRRSASPPPARWGVNADTLSARFIHLGPDDVFCSLPRGAFHHPPRSRIRTASAVGSPPPPPRTTRNRVFLSARSPSFPYPGRIRSPFAFGAAGLKRRRKTPAARTRPVIRVNPVFFFLTVFRPRLPQTRSGSKIDFRPVARVEYHEQTGGCVGRSPRTKQILDSEQDASPKIISPNEYVRFSNATKS